MISCLSSNIWYLIHCSHQFKFCLCSYILSSAIKTFLRISHKKVFQILESQQSPPTSDSQASYGMSVVRILETIDHIITTLHCTLTTAQLGRVVPHADVIKWKDFPHYWPFVWGIHRWPVNSPLKGQWRGALMFSVICTWTNGWVHNREAGDLRCHCTHYDVTVMIWEYISSIMHMSVWNMI